MQRSVIIQSNGTGQKELNELLSQGWKVVSITANHSSSYNDFLIIIEKEDAPKKES